MLFRSHINHWIESAGASRHAGLLASLLPHSMGSRFKSPSMDKQRIVEEPEQKRLKLPGLSMSHGHNINDEVARLSSEVATLKNLLVNRMKDEEEEDRGPDEN